MGNKWYAGLLIVVYQERGEKCELWRDSSVEIPGGVRVGSAGVVSGTGSVAASRNQWSLRSSAVSAPLRWVILIAESQRTRRRTIA